jgi:hypothetical protein
MIPSWAEYIKTNWEKGWKMNNALDQVLKDNNMSPYEIMCAFKWNTVSTTCFCFAMSISSDVATGIGQHGNLRDLPENC